MTQGDAEETVARSPRARERAPAGTRSRAKALIGPVPRDRAALAAWVREHLGIQLPHAPLLETSTASLDYLAHAFFEGRVPGSPALSADAVVWANRGGGKTFLGAVATLLDLIFKPGIEVRILGGSLEQSQRMHEHLRRFFEGPGLDELLSAARNACTQSRLRLKNGSAVEILAQSQTAVRGTRVQKLRCDEVDLFDPEVWEAAQLVTRSMRCEGPWGGWVRGSVEALSTMHRPSGLMWSIVADARLAGAGAAPGGEEEPASEPRRGGRTLFRWGVVDALEHCPPERACAACGLQTECAGRAKRRPPEAAGHITIDDALTLKGRVGQATWDAEMLCRRPRRDDAVLPEFGVETHVFDAAEEPALAGALFAGMDFGFRAPTVIVWAVQDGGGVLRVIGERVASGVTLEHHARALTEHARGRPVFVGADPAGNQRNDQTGQSNIAELRRRGLVVRARASGIEEGLRCLRDRLKPATGAPTLLVSSRCVKLIESLQRYRYPEGRPEAHEPLKDGHDHAVDALRYLVLNLDRPHRTVGGSYLGR